MKILFVDDDENRIRQFTRAQIGDDVCVARDVETAVEWLRRESPFDLISLDHDLIGVFQAHGTACGCAVVDSLTRQALHNGTYPQTIVLHSFNPESVAMMHRDARKIATLLGGGLPRVVVAKFGTDAYREAVGGNWE